MKTKFLLAASAAAILATVSYAQEPAGVIDQAEALALDAKIYAETYGVPFNEAVTRLAIMTEASSVAADAETEEGADFGGTYFDNSAASFELVVRTKKQIKVDKTVKKTAKAEQRAKWGDKAARKARKDARQAAKKALKVSDLEIEAAEDALAADKAIKVRYKVRAPHSKKDALEAFAAIEAKAHTIPGFVSAWVDEVQGT